MKRPALAVGLALLLVLAGCDNFPRGAGLRGEILRGGMFTEDPDAPRTFAVEPVTRDTVPTYLHWPAVGEDDYRWIERVDQPENRIIAAGDSVTVTIWSTEENGLLTVPGQRFVTMPNLRVSSTGRIFLPYVGEIRVAGMSPERARATIEESYYAVAPSTQVQLELTEGRQNTVSLVSGVRAPGAYPLPDQDFTVMELLALGGGVAAGMNNPQIRLQRGSHIYGTSVRRLLDEPRLDTTLVGGDKIYAEEDERYFLALGAAGRESIYDFPKDQVTALDALSIIGGVNEGRADARGILILRRYPESVVTPDRSGPDHARTIFTIDLTSADGLFSAGQFLIRPRDLVYVSEAPITAAGSIIGLAASVFGLALQADSL